MSKASYRQRNGEARLAVVKANQAARAKRTPAQQLALLDKRVGPDGARRERARLQAPVKKTA